MHFNDDILAFNDWFNKTFWDVATENESIKTGKLIKRLADVIYERDKLKKALELERFSHANTRKSWDATCQERDNLQQQIAALQAEKEDKSKEISELLKSVDKITENFLSSISILQAEKEKLMSDYMAQQTLCQNNEFKKEV